MATEMRYCAECRAITPHEVLGGKGIAANLCRECVLRWAGQPEVKDRPVKEKVDGTGRRLHANPKRRGESQS
jgi:hypothetical protein